MAPIGQEELRALLRASELFGPAPDHELDHLARRAQRIQAPRGRVLFMNQDEGTEVMFVASGRVKIVSTASTGAEVIHNIVEASQIFGEMAVLDGKPRSADAVAAIDSDIAIFSGSDFLGVLDRNPKTAIQMMALLCGRIRRSTSFVEDAILRDSATRLLNRLKSLANEYGKESEGGRSIRIEHKLSQQEIGESVGLTRVSVNRVFSEWRSGGLIQDGRGFIIVPDWARLEESVYGPR